MPNDKQRKGGKYIPDTAFLVTDGAPAAAPDQTDTPALKQAKVLGDVAASIPYNATKQNEYSDTPQATVTGEVSAVFDELANASTLSEKNGSDKTGGAADGGVKEYKDGSLDKDRAPPTQGPLSTNQGVLLADNQSSLKAGVRGPALLKDFILREKITHFDHERIPERVVHARGSGAHGFFECFEGLQDLTCAAPFTEKGKQTPVFVRFSTVAGERGSKDTARDVRGFAIKFYTDQGNWDLVANNMPVFFIQDAIKFPDLVHAVKPEPHHAMPQAASAHDTFWDFVSLMPESTHMLMWQMSDRAIPRSFRMMQGFGVHTFRFVTREGKSTFVKFHLTPKLGTHSLVWDEAVKIAGADPDFNRRDLWEAIETGEYPEWTFGVQLVSEEDAEKFSFDLLDSTKIIPEELVPVKPIGRLVLNRNPDNFFAETEQVAFCAAHVIPGIDFTNDPLLAGRIHSYQDTQLSRLGGPNFHELPINAPRVPVNNNQRDGMHRQTIHRGRAAYEPNSLGGGCPFQAGGGGFVAFPEPVSGVELTGKPEKFAEHYNQARLFFNSQTAPEQKHIIDGFAFELSKVTVPAVRIRMVSMLRNVSDELAAPIAKKLGITELPPPMPLATDQDFKPEVEKSAFLSLTAHPGEEGIKTRKVAILCEDGVDGAAVRELGATLIEQGAVVRIVSSRLGEIAGAGGAVEADTTYEASPSVVFDAMVVPGGKAAAEALMKNGEALGFVRTLFRHCKPMLVLGEGSQVLKKAGIDPAAGYPGVHVASKGSEDLTGQFIDSMTRHRSFERETDPPLV
ncbi:catalase [Halopseudomonas bauzanensis]|uniref:catalase n=1 Tax=Halopseudomonas bauzanensis TaxID=653930 RepID=UPI0025527A58|nr:catalase [Halopseudomonas bauzanensis]